MRKKAYDYEHERAELLEQHQRAAAQPAESPFWQGLASAAAGAVAGGGLGLVASLGRVPLPRMKAMTYGASLGALLGGGSGVAAAMKGNAERDAAAAVLARPEVERERFLGAIAREAEIMKRENMAWDRQFHQDLRSDLRRIYF